MLKQEIFNEVKKAGGCIFGGGTKHQRGFLGLCRAAVGESGKYCPRHEAEVAAIEAAQNARAHAKQVQSVNPHRREARRA